MNTVNLEAFKNLSKLAKAEPRFRRAARKAGTCTRTVYENGQPVKTEVVAPVVVAPTPAAPRATGSTKAQVRVNGALFASVYAAFVALNLPVAKHVKFRAEFKKGNTNVFAHNGTNFVFEGEQA